ncbi:hypothetical protein GVO57_11055 [Sphingomonas changnyeongensis]|uniref:YqaJ viral recombinase domain-containing protein n=1 Tax=Sphingomonas changnyeongensis TaxID=2698679 RepID=A0A7Z2NWU1_9SPHN|nr:YqaJ viral recombinase family protein [Sphingomonas changnyeongensis]QHL91250.1 hypothetical protein GVO57_11055 [Sphingomonas changnyeongensis]
MNAISTREAWLAERRTGIGGSDVAAILGVSPYRSALDVFLDKRGLLVDQAESEPMRWGTLLEPVVRQEYANRTGRSVALPEGVLRHPRYGFMLANLDGIATDRLYEGKTARTAEGWGEPGSDEVPQGYLLQVQHYMAVTGYDVTDIAVLIGGSDFRIYTVEADAELHEMLVEAEAEFWRRVTDDDPPEPITMADALKRWGRQSRADSVIACPEVAEAVDQLRAIKAAQADLAAREEAAKLTIMAALGDADTLVARDGTTLCTWKAAKAAARLDSRALKAAHPEIYSAFLKADEPNRRFLIK